METKVKVVIFEGEVLGVYTTKPESIAKMSRDVLRRYEEFIQHKPNSTPEEERFNQEKFRSEISIKKAILK